MASAPMTGNQVLGLGAVSAGLDLMGGLFGYFAADQMAEAAASQGRMLRMEAEADAQRYAEQARGITAQQKLAFLKSGVQLTGSPLAVIDNDILTAQENINAIRARGAAQQEAANREATSARMSGRNALLQGITSGLGKLAWASYAKSSLDRTASENRKDIPGYSRLQPTKKMRLF